MADRSDRDVLAAFHRRFGAIERIVPEPPAFPETVRRRPFMPTAIVAAGTTLALVVAIGLSLALWPGRGPASVLPTDGASQTSEVAQPTPGQPSPYPSESTVNVTMPACVSGAYVVPETYARYEDMRGHGMDQPLIPGGVQFLAEGSGPDVDGLSRRLPSGLTGLPRITAWQLANPPIAVTLFGPQATLEGLTFQGFQRDGGVVAKQVPTTGIDAERLADELGPRAQVLTVGGQQVALVIGDEVLGIGHRAVGLYWSDGTSDWSITASLARVSPEAVLAIAATLYC